MRQTTLHQAAFDAGMFHVRLCKVVPCHLPVFCVAPALVFTEAESRRVTVPSSIPRITRHTRPHKAGIGFPSRPLSSWPPCPRSCFLPDLFLRRPPACAFTRRGGNSPHSSCCIQDRLVKTIFGGAPMIYKPGGRFAEIFWTAPVWLLKAYWSPGLSNLFPTHIACRSAHQYVPRVGLHL